MITTMRELEAAFNYAVDEGSPDIRVNGHCFTPSNVLKRCDPIAHRADMLDWADSEGIDTDELED